ncbi:hypothetical protein BM221_010617 [Beauveria bassiana]|uniref:NmrA-like domain-containing protein n=1 Tax=Beauveria bassiana TaxID=176275 RepID=A0A2N6N8B8_BEABA|nr:hypothetical protein BM221_010617 [Beauveria bassiana]
MVFKVVAIARGTGELGRTLMEAIRKEGKCAVIMLSRQTSTDEFAPKQRELGLERQIRAPIIEMQYLNVANVQKTPEDHRKYY